MVLLYPGRRRQQRDSPRRGTFPAPSFFLIDHLFFGDMAEKGLYGMMGKLMVMGLAACLGGCRGGDQQTIKAES